MDDQTFPPASCRGRCLFYMQVFDNAKDVIRMRRKVTVLLFEIELLGSLKRPKTFNLGIYVVINFVKNSRNG